MYPSLLRTLASVIAVGLLGGCAAIKFSEIQAAAPSIEACIQDNRSPAPAPANPAEAAFVAAATRVKADALTGHLHFTSLINQFATASEPSVRIAPSSPNAGASDFKIYLSQARSRANASVPGTLQSDPVFGAVRDIMIKATATASMQQQLATARALGVPIAQADIDEVSAFKPRESLGHDDLKTFAKLMMSYGLHPTMQTSAGAAGAPAAPGSAPSPSGTANSFSKYFNAYYSGKFYDRLGVAIAKPTVSLTISDAEIAAALTMLLEYAADLYDPTPVMVNGGTYYPGNNGNEPTALTIGLAKSQTIGTDTGCDWNTSDAPVLGNLASAASDQAGAVGGLVTGTFGGWELGLGFLGKFSLGDNQTVSTIAKTFASRIAERATLASIYWALASTKHTANAASPDAMAQMVTYHTQ